VSSGWVAALVGLGFGVLLVRRRSLATLLLAAQALLLGLIALDQAAGEGGGGGLAVAAAILLVRALAIPGLLVLARRRTPEPALIAPATGVWTRLLAGSVVVLVAGAALPPLGLATGAAENGAVALLALGIAIAAMRRPALLQVLGVLVAENGVYLLAIAVPGGLPALIELGVLLDLGLVIAVTVAFAGKIHAEVGSGDTDLLRRLRD
jgi:hydrogenase-4 component E